MTDPRRDWIVIVYRDGEELGLWLIRNETRAEAERSAAGDVADEYAGHEWTIEEAE